MSRTTAIVSLAAVVLATCAGALPASTLHVVTQTSFAFNPDTITIAAGDTVRWVWTSLSHTVTNGTGALDPNAGTLFDAPLDSGHPTFQFEFTTDGTVNYFCRPHEGLGMKGAVIVTPVTAIGGGAPSAALELRQNVPNPFNPNTRIVFEIARAGRISLRIHDVSGRPVRTLADGILGAGRHDAAWDGRDEAGTAVASGVYLCTLETAGGVETRKLILLR